MGQDVCLDTDFVIALIRGDQKANVLLEKLIEAKISISSITVFELNLRETNLEIIDDLISNVNILPLDSKVAKKASIMFKELKKTGKLVELRDLFIAATAIVNDCFLLTFNKKHFEKIKGLKIFH